MTKIILDSQQKIIAEKLQQLALDLEKQASNSFFKKIIPPLTQTLSRTSWGEGVLYKSFYIHGGVGCGKSMLMKDFFASLKKTPKIYFHFNSFMKAIHEALRDIRKHHQFPLPLWERVRVRGKFKDELIEATKRVIKKNKLLCLDEFQVLDIADAMILGRIFSYLFLQKIAVVFTSNSHPQELYKNGLQREVFLNFINQVLLKNCQVLHLNNSIDYRLQHLQNLSQKYFISNQKNRQEIQKIIKNLTADQKPKITKLKVWGREVKIKKTFTVLLSSQTPQQVQGDSPSPLQTSKLSPRTCCGVCKIAIFTFDELCRTELAAADYQAICQNFDLIFLLKIPKLSAAEVNEARRFLLFIDEIYENKTALILLAKTKAEKIYESGIGFEAFKRAVSRLNEIQSDQYWQLSKINVILDLLRKSRIS